MTDMIFCEFAHTLGKLNSLLSRPILWDELKERGVTPEEFLFLREKINDMSRIFYKDKKSMIVYQSKEVKKK